MRAGKLRETIRIVRPYVSELSAAGVPETTLQTIATARAELVQSTAEDILRQDGSATESLVVFRTRLFIGVTVADRVAHAGGLYAIKALSPDKRRRSLDITATCIGEDCQ